MRTTHPRTLPRLAIATLAAALATPPAWAGRHDGDADGIRDDVDLCPSVPEDLDGFQDEDGCPDPDNDGDGILDVEDRCPLEPESLDGFEDADGCPEAALVSPEAANAAAIGVPRTAGAPPPGARCLPVVAAHCGCVYSCGIGVPDPTGWSIRHPHWPDPIRGQVGRWCVEGECTDAFFGDIVCGVVCPPRAADPTCRFEGAACVGRGE